MNKLENYALMSVKSCRGFLSYQFPGRNHSVIRKRTDTEHCCSGVRWVYKCILFELLVLRCENSRTKLRHLEIKIRYDCTRNLWQMISARERKHCRPNSRRTIHTTIRSQLHACL